MAPPDQVKNGHRPQPRGGLEQQHRLAVPNPGQQSRPPAARAGLSFTKRSEDPAQWIGGGGAEPGFGRGHTRLGLAATRRTPSGFWRPLACARCAVIFFCSEIQYRGGTRPSSLCEPTEGELWCEASGPELALTGCAGTSVSISAVGTRPAVLQWGRSFSVCRGFRMTAPSRAYPRAPGPSSESLQGRNPREVGIALP